MSSFPDSDFHSFAQYVIAAIGKVFSCVNKQSAVAVQNGTNVGLVVHGSFLTSEGGSSAIASIHSSNLQPNEPFCILYLHLLW